VTRLLSYRKTYVNDLRDRSMAYHLTRFCSPTKTSRSIRTVTSKNRNAYLQTRIACHANNGRRKHLLGGTLATHQNDGTDTPPTAKA